MNRIFFTAHIFIIGLFSCKEQPEAVIKIKAERVSSELGAVGYHTYASDTAWDKMRIFGDSLRMSYPPGTTVMAAFLYPEDAVPGFKPGTFASKSVENKESFLIANYIYNNDTIEFIRHPESFVSAKEHEAKNSK